jgi:methionine-gamma-lyase
MREGARLVVDNTFMTPYLQRPLSLGADLVLHSATKYLNGHGDVVAGVLVGNRADMDIIRSTIQKDIGGVVSPHDAWLILRGVKTLALRMKEHEKNAMAVARYLHDHPKVAVVHYPGLPSHPQHELARRQADGFGGMLSMELKGGYEAGKTLMNGIQLFHLAVSLGAVDSLIQHPASMTHAGICREDRLAGGITDGLVRISVGIEDADDLIGALDQALARVE